MWGNLLQCAVRGGAGDQCTAGACSYYIRGCYYHRSPIQGSSGRAAHQAVRRYFVSLWLCGSQCRSLTQTQNVCKNINKDGRGKKKMPKDEPVMLSRQKKNKREKISNTEQRKMRGGGGRQRGGWRRARFAARPSPPHTKTEKNKKAERIL